MKLENKKVLVTGCAGFVGSHLVDGLLEEGAIVYGIDNYKYGNNRNTKAIEIWLDFTIRDRLVDYFKEIKPDYVFHVGAWGRMPMCLEDPIGAYENNLIGTLNVLEASRQAGVKKVVLSSSCIVYCQPTPYWSTKRGLEDVARVYRETYGLPTICLRYGNIYGQRQRVGQDSAMFAMLRDSYNKTKQIHIFGDGEQTRDWINVKDIVEANIQGVLKEFKGELDICTGNSISLNYIIDVLKQITPDIKVIYQEERKGDEKHIELNPEPAKRVLDFEAKIKFEEGIKEVWKP
jgi:UDP-glucose 4-epimerase